MMKDIQTDDELDQIIKENDIALVDFYTTWCVPCKILTPRLEELANGTKNDGMKIAFCKVDCEKVVKMADIFKITSVPTTVFFVKGKPDKKIIVGCEQVEMYKSKLDEIAKDIDGYASKMEVLVSIEKKKKTTSKKKK